MAETKRLVITCGDKTYFDADVEFCEIVTYTPPWTGGPDIELTASIKRDKA